MSISIEIIMGIIAFFIFCIVIYYKLYISKLIKLKKRIYNEIVELELNLKNNQQKINEIKDIEKEAFSEHKRITEENDKLLKEKYNYEQSLKRLKIDVEHANNLVSKIQENSNKLNEIENKINSLSELEKDADKKINTIKGNIDLYSRIDDFVSYGFFENPEYLYETAERFASEIKSIREQQKNMIAKDEAIIISGKKINSNRLLFVEETCKKQKRLVIRSFNIECDFLISKVNPSNFERTLNRIKDVANTLESDIADFRMGINNEYIELKYRECLLQYQFKLKKKEEQEEQKAIREQIREEEKARKEYEKTLLEAQKEESIYQKLLNDAQEAMAKATDTERDAMALRIHQLETELEAAKAKAERALSMAEQTRKGYVYIISNIGSFGEGVYKIGLTRRLDPTERVRELGDASVPFGFDIHAMIASEDAPLLENALHKAFASKRVNAVNMRKEFFNVSLEEIKKKVQEITGSDNDFIMTVVAEEYYQTKRLISKEKN